MPGIIRLRTWPSAARIERCEPTAPSAAERRCEPWVRGVDPYLQPDGHDAQIAQWSNGIVGPYRSAAGRVGVAHVGHGELADVGELLEEPGSGRELRQRHRRARSEPERICAPEGQHPVKFT